MNEKLANLDEKTQKNVLNWLEGQYDEETKETIKNLIENNIDELKNAFFQKLSFGTGGARGIMGVGTNRLNKYTLQFAAQGLANFLLKEHPDKKNSVMIGYDNRNHSAEFGEVTARVLAGNGITAYLFNELRPTPLVSFACRYKECDAAVMITASHNPPAYNGFKVYGPDGGQVLPPSDKMIIDEVNNIEDPSQVKMAENDSPLIVRIDNEIDLVYLETIKKLILQHKKGFDKKALKTIYTNLHGTGITLLPQALEEWGFSTPLLVKEQTTIDGNFTYAPKPNPEEKEALSLGIELMKKEQADLLLASDPDADRMGAVVLHNGQEVILTGNQIGSILLFHIASSLAEENLLEPSLAVIKSIVTTELMKEIATSFDIICFDVLTGFKYIGEKMTQWDRDKSYKFLFGAEESLGFLFGTHARDKDAVIAACLICDAAAKAKSEGKTLVDLLHSIYKHYGIYRESLVSIGFEEGEKGMKQMAEVMKKQRIEKPSKIGNYTICQIDDYQEGQSLILSDGTTNIINLPKSNVLTYHFEDGTKLVVRPSGTEPKIKIYAQTSTKEYSSIEDGIKTCDERLKAMIGALEEEIKTNS